MATIRDMMPAFELFQPVDIDGALALLAEHGKDAWVLAGGLDSFDWLKERAKRPKVVVDLGGIQELHGIRTSSDGLEIGALTTLTEIANDDGVLSRFPVLAEAALAVATPQIRNQATLGGNVSQDTRCWYYRSGWPCYRAEGNICYASTPTSMNREHCIFGASRCVAVNPSDTAPALIALDAEAVIRSRRGERVVEIDKYFIGPSIDITRMTVLRPGDLLTAIRIPESWASARFYFEKVADRKAWDFPLVNIAASMAVANGRIERARLVVGGVAPYPLRLRRVEAAIAGEAVNETTAEMAGMLAVKGAKPLRHNEYKVGLVKNLVKRAIRAQEV